MRIAYGFNGEFINVLCLVLDFQFLEFNDYPMIRRRSYDGVTINVRRILLRKTGTGHTDFGAVARKMNCLIAVHDPLGEVGLGCAWN